MCLLDTIAKWIPVSDIPELIIKLYLPGDDCLDDTTISQVFTRSYEFDSATYMDHEFRVLHSFNDQPAVSDPTCKEWYRNGKLHRDNDKPAMIFWNGSEEWFKNGIRYREDDKPLLVRKDGTKFWLDKYNNYHRENDKPAIICSSGKCEWYIHGKFVKSDN